jgi:hypothetical protein
LLVSFEITATVEEASMRLKKIAVSMFMSGLVLIIGLGVWLASAQPVRAQCGSQASSCKNCHETQAQDPVNNDGTTWHTQHAFGDFCYLCHGGNNQSMDKDTAHAGMANPLSDVVLACKSCHAADYEAKAKIYATTLGVTVGTGSATQAPAASQPVAASTPDLAASATPTAEIPAANMVDYTQQYNQSVLGQQPTNWGNVILIVLAVLLILGGGGFVLLNEKFVRIRFKIRYGDTQKMPDSFRDEYPGDVIDMLPGIASLDPRARTSLKKILDQPAKTDKVLHLIDEIVSDSEPKE